MKNISVYKNIEVSDPETGPMPGDIESRFVKSFLTREGAENFIRQQKSPCTFSYVVNDEDGHPMVEVSPGYVEGKGYTWEKKIETDMQTDPAGGGGLGSG